MRAVTVEQRKLCAMALRVYVTLIMERQAEYGDQGSQYRNIVAAEDLAEQFEAEVKAAETAKETRSYPFPRD